MKKLLIPLILIVPLVAAAAAVQSLVVLSWEDPTPPATKVVKYEVYGKMVEAADWKPLGSVTNKFIQMTNLANGTWHFMVAGVSDLGIKGDNSTPSASIKIDPIGLTPLAVTNLKVLITYSVEVP
jgi:hypothetical protein